MNFTMFMKNAYVLLIENLDRMKNFKIFRDISSFIALNKSKMLSDTGARLKAFFNQEKKPHS